MTNLPASNNSSNTSRRASNKVAFVSIAAAMTALTLSGCMRRTVRVTSEPPGASVTVNDIQVGRTPCEFDFTYYGTYDVLWTLDGYEPFRKAMPTNAPLYEYPPVDMAATAWPGGITTIRNWHVSLSPSLESTIGEDDEKRQTFEKHLVGRAKAARSR